MFGGKLAINLGVISDEGRQLEFRLKRPKESVVEDCPSKTSKLTVKITNTLFAKRNAINPFPQMCTLSNSLQHQCWRSFDAVCSLTKVAGDLVEHSPGN